LKLATVVLAPLTITTSLIFFPFILSNVKP
jgi:hypothetical protein